MTVKVFKFSYETFSFNYTAYKIILVFPIYLLVMYKLLTDVH
jgi:hypothetical protein